MIDKDAKTTFLEGKGREGKEVQVGREALENQTNTASKVVISTLYFVANREKKGGGCHLERQQFLKA